MIKCKYFIYLLKSETASRTYIGYSVNVFRRLKQHNGILSGGAKKTQKGRPWKLIMFVSGFNYEKTAYQYEFCIQHPPKGTKRRGILNQMKIMKRLLRKDKICKTAPPNKENKYILFFMEEKYYHIWNSFK